MSRVRSALMAAVMLASTPLAGCGAPAVDCSMYQPSTPDHTTDDATYSSDAVDYFSDIAFGSEYGGGAREIHKWTEDIRIAVHGDPTSTDLRTLCDVVGDINGLVDGVEVSVVGRGQNINLYFVPEDRFSRIQPGVVPGNLGFVWIWWDETGGINKATVLISTTEVTQEERSHLIREELTQSLGLLRDSYAHPDSIFYQEWSEVEEYSNLDEAVIEILYLPEVTPGMTEEEALAVIPRG